MDKEMTEEQYLYQQIRIIQEQYQKQIQPYLDRIYRIRSLELPTYRIEPSSISWEKLDKLAKAGPQGE